MIDKLDKLSGLSGSVTDEDFGVIAKYLEYGGQLLYEEERAEGAIGSVEQAYLVTGKTILGDETKGYVLRYQIRTPRTPEGVDYQYLFTGLHDPEQ